MNKALGGGGGGIEFEQGTRGGGGLFNLNKALGGGAI